MADKLSTAARTLLLTAILLLCACASDKNSLPSEKITKTTCRVAVVMPLSNQMAKSHYTTLISMVKEYSEIAQLDASHKIELEVELYDEDTEDMEKLAKRITERTDIDYIIGPSSSENVFTFAPFCISAEKCLITPSASSYDLIRTFAPKKNTDNDKEEFKNGFLWTLTEPDISQCEIGLTTLKNYGIEEVSLIAADNIYGKTFSDWFAFQATELDLKIGKISTYSDTTQLKEIIDDFNETINYPRAQAVLCATASPYDVNIIESRGTFNALYTDNTFTLELFGQDAELPAYFSGISPSHDPESGFGLRYQQIFGQKCMNTESQFYDALLMAMFAKAYKEKHPDISAYEAVNRIVSAEGREEFVWTPTGMEDEFKAIENGAQLLNIRGASGYLNFDETIKTCVTGTCYCRWVYDMTDKIHIVEYISSNGTHRTSSNLGAWNWEKTLRDIFDDDTEYRISTIPHDNWALLVAASTGWKNYRHQADVLRMYQLLKANGYDDDHIILIMEDDLANDPNNPTPGTVIAPDGTNIRKDANIDYKTSELSPDDIAYILAGEKKSHLPKLIEADSTHNVLVFWSGHGLYEQLNWADRRTGMTRKTMEEVLSLTVQKRNYRKMLWLVEACYSESVMRAAEGYPHILCITAANSYEESKADVYDSNYKTYLTNRFTVTLEQALEETPNISMRDLYYKLARNTVASHTCIINQKFNENLFQSYMEEFVIPLKSH